ncbi:MAG: acyl-ACP--UDP-N-acetylglucosamine O-acyltransferase [Bacteroides sp.]|nr:acyl-ACP--UDP-N-acetylglucosamine O-acyltransferase [Bacteroides sp.]MCM1390181.1 acyl-ACP--UDP-N-acetylglucosamine O-acyltransferase [Bacteroides sp.]
MISPLSHVDPSAKIGKNVTIHPFAYIDADVEIGDDCEIMPYASVIKGTRMGKHNKVYQGAIIGADPQDFRWKGESTYCHIGDNNIIREYVIINRGIRSTGGTFIGDDCFIAAESHIGHDSVIAGRTVLGNGTMIAGDCKVGKCTILSSGAMLHERSEVGDWVLIKGGCRILGNVPPYVVIAHNPASYYGINAIIMGKHGFTPEQIDDVAKSYRHLYQSGTSVFNALQRIEADVAPSDIRSNIVDFIRNHDLKIVAIPTELE